MTILCECPKSLHPNTHSAQTNSYKYKYEHINLNYSFLNQLVYLPADLLAAHNKTKHTRGAAWQLECLEFRETYKKPNKGGHH